MNIKLKGPNLEIQISMHVLGFEKKEMFGGNE